jgi:hypothetical protein
MLGGSYNTVPVSRWFGALEVCLQVSHVIQAKRVQPRFVEDAEHGLKRIKGYSRDATSEKTGSLTMTFVYSG